LYRSPPDTLLCDLSSVTLTLSEPITWDTTILNWRIPGSLNGGSLRCKGSAAESFVQPIAATPVTAYRALLGLSLDFPLSAPVGPIGFYDVTVPTLTGDRDTLSANLLVGSVSAQTDPSLYHLWFFNGTFTASKP